MFSCDMVQMKVVVSVIYFILIQAKEDTSILSEDLIDTCPTAGFENIKKFLKESSDRMVAVKSGMSYEEHVRLAEVHYWTIHYFDP